MSRIKGLFLSISYIFIFGLCSAQQVPNIVATDINGVERNLHSYLDEGKVVIVDVFATWCTACWGLHKQEMLHKLYSTYGPDGTDQLEILYIEADENTSIESLYGDSSFGDWTEGVPFPILNLSEVSDEFTQAFAVDGVPTSSVICPSSKEIIADIYQNDLDEIIEILQECNTIYNVSDLQIIETNQKDVAICDSIQLQVEVLNSGTEIVNTFELEAVLVDGTIFNTHHCVVDLSPGENIDVNLGTFGLADVQENEIVSVQILTQDDVLANNEQSITFKHAKEVNSELTLLVAPDTWVAYDNTRWWVENSLGEKVIPETIIESEQSNEITFSLENNDCFTFVIVDDYGDGMLFGEILLTTNDGFILFDNTDFKFRGEVSFEYIGTVTSSQELLSIEETQLSLTPTIVDDEVTVRYALNRPELVALSIFDIHGKLLFTQSILSDAGETSTQINAGAYPKGLYFLRMSTVDGILTEKFTKQ